MHGRWNVTAGAMDGLFAFDDPDVFVIPVAAGIAGKIQKHQEEDE